VDPALVAALVGTAGSLIGLFFSFVADRRESRQTREESLDDRIAALAKALQAASRTITEIESEVAARQKLVTRLEADAETAKQLAALHKEQVEAVAQVFQGALDTTTRHTERLSWLQGFLFFVLGAAVAVAVAVLF
jgi:DNA-binding XRE family transcriptional regulator